MKLVTAIIKPDKVEALRQALTSVDASAVVRMIFIWPNAAYGPWRFE